MQNTLDLIADLRKRLQGFNHDLDLKIQDLIKEGLLTPKDKDKLNFNAQATLEALTRFTENTTYEDMIKKELLVNLVKDYEMEASELIAAIEMRRYSEYFLLERADRIKQHVLSESISPDVKKIAEPKIKSLESQLRDDIHIILKKVSHKPQLLEVLLHEFERDVSTVLKTRIGSRD